MHSTEGVKPLSPSIGTLNDLATIFKWPSAQDCRSWLCHLMYASAAVCLLGLWVRILPRAQMFVASVVCCHVEVSAMSWSLIPKESYWLWCVVCDLENLKTEEAMASIGPLYHWGGEGREEEKRHKAERISVSWQCAIAGCPIKESKWKVQLRGNVDIIGWQYCSHTQHITCHRVLCLICKRVSLTCLSCSAASFWCRL